MREVLTLSEVATRELIRVRDDGTRLSGNLENAIESWSLGWVFLEHASDKIDEIRAVSEVSLHELDLVGDLLPVDDHLLEVIEVRNWIIGRRAYSSDAQSEDLVLLIVVVLYLLVGESSSERRVLDVAVVDALVVQLALQEVVVCNNVGDS